MIPAGDWRAGIIGHTLIIGHHFADR